MTIPEGNTVKGNLLFLKKSEILLREFDKNQ
jgi:hypothetical protein